MAQRLTDDCVSQWVKGGLYIWVVGVDVEISMHQFPVAPIVYGSNRELMHRDLYINTPHSDI